MSKRTLILITAFAVVSLIYATIYAAGQHILRLSANDPQIQLAEDGAAELGQGKPIIALTQNLPTVNLATSLAPFTMVVDSHATVLASSGQLDGQMPALPPGVLTYAKPGHSYRLTWQPRPGVRIATVIALSGDRYVVAGRSLREVEQRESELLLIVGLAWLASVVMMLIVKLLILTPATANTSKQPR